MEALIRWHNATRGTVQPNDFIPLLEETGLIVEIGKWVLLEACLQGVRWHEAGYPIGVAVNVSARQLDTDEFVVDVEGSAARDRARPADSLTIEITETAVMRDVEQTVGAPGEGQEARRAHRDRRLRHRLLLDGAPAAAFGRRAQDRPLVHHPDDPQRGGRDDHPHARAARQGALDRDTRRGHRAGPRAEPAAGRALRQRPGVPVRAAARATDTAPFLRNWAASRRSRRASVFGRRSPAARWRFADTSACRRGR